MSPEEIQKVRANCVHDVVGLIAGCKRYTVLGGLAIQLESDLKGIDDKVAIIKVFLDSGLWQAIKSRAVKQIASENTEYFELYLRLVIGLDSAMLSSFYSEKLLDSKFQINGDAQLNVPNDTLKELASQSETFATKNYKLDGEQFKAIANAIHYSGASGGGPLIAISTNIAIHIIEEDLISSKAAATPKDHYEQPLVDKQRVIVGDSRQGANSLELLFLRVAGETKPADKNHPLRILNSQAREILKIETDPKIINRLMINYEQDVRTLQSQYLDRSVAQYQQQWLSETVGLNASSLSPVQLQRAMLRHVFGGEGEQEKASLQNWSDRLRQQLSTVDNSDGIRQAVTDYHQQLNETRQQFININTVSIASDSEALVSKETQKVILQLLFPDAVKLAQAEQGQSGPGLFATRPRSRAIIGDTRPRATGSLPQVDIAKVEAVENLKTLLQKDECPTRRELVEQLNKIKDANQKDPQYDAARMLIYRDQADDNLNMRPTM